MTFRSVYNEEQGGFLPLRAPPNISQNVGLQENIKGLFIDNFNDVGVLDYMGCARLGGVRSIARNSSKNPTAQV